MLKCWCLVLVSSLLALTACTKQSATYCDTHRDDARCAPPDGAGPACMGDPDCAGMAGTEVCDVGTQTCVQCLAPDSTAACTGTTPVCGDDHACRGCTTHAECPSKACLPDGACAPDADVAYVGPSGADGAPCTQAQPCATLQDALSTDRPIVKFASGTISDGNNTIIDGRAVTILAEAGAVLDRSSDGPILELRGTTTDVKIFDLEISGATTASGHGLYMSTGTPKVALTRVKVANNQGSGISAAGGTLTVTQSTVAGNTGGGISMSVNGVVTLTNNFIYRNGDSASTSYGGLSLRPTTGSKVEFNTIVDNEANTGSASAGGVFCDVAGFVASNNIIFRNTGGSAGNVQTFGNCTYGNSFNMPGASNVDNALQFAQPNLAPFDYRLTASSPATVLDAAGACTGSDFEGDSRPSGAACDLGADEYLP